MAQRRNRHCRQCGREAPRGTRISQSGLCRDCGLANMGNATVSIVKKAGDAYERWRAGMTDAAAKAALYEVDPDNPMFQPPLCPGCMMRSQTVSGLCVVCEFDRVEYG